MKQNRKKNATPEELLRASCEEGMGGEPDYTRVKERLNVEAIARAGTGRKAVSAPLPPPPVSSRRSAAATVCLVLAVLILIPAVAVGSFVIARMTMDPAPPDEGPGGTLDHMPPLGTDPDQSVTPSGSIIVTPRPIPPNTTGEAWGNLFNLSESYVTDNAVFLRAEHLDSRVAAGELPAVLKITERGEWDQFFSDATLGITVELQEALGELNEEFFTENSLLVVVTEGRSGSIRYRLEEVYTTNEKVHRAWELVAQVPPALTMDIVHWCVVIPVSKAEAQVPMELSMRDEPMWDVVAPDDVITDIVISDPHQLWFWRDSYAQNGCLYGRLEYNGDWSYPYTQSVNTLSEWQSLYLGCTAGSISDGGFTEGLAALDEAFFAEQSLLILYVAEGSGSYRHRVDEVAVEGEALRVTLTTLYHEMDTCDMAAWAILIPIDKAYGGLPVELVTRQKPDFPHVKTGAGYLYGETIHANVFNDEALEKLSLPKGQTVDSVQTYQAAVLPTDDPQMPAELRRAMSSFDEAFFEEKALLILYLENESDDVHYEVDPLVIQDGWLYVGVSGRYPEEGSGPSLGGSGYRVILMPVDKELANLRVGVYMLK